MTKWVHADVLDNGLNDIKNNCDKLIVFGATAGNTTYVYAAGDNYATVTGQLLAEVAMSGTDFTLGNGASSSRTLTSATGKQDASANAANHAATGANNHFAFLDTANTKVLLVTDETSSQDVVAGNPVDFPSLVYTSSQPT